MLKNRLFAPLLALMVAGCGLAPTHRAATNEAIAHVANVERFLAQPSVQAKAPAAFSLQSESLAFLQVVERRAEPQRDALVSAIRSDVALSGAIARFEGLSWDEQLPVLKRVMELEGRAMGFTLPPLVIQHGPSQRPAYFDFDPERPGTGTVILYPEALAREKSRYAALLLLVHETRHSAQFQLAYQSSFGSSDERVLSEGYRASFVAQKKLEGELGYCDFCSLNGEFEAFQAANYVVGRLTSWQVDTRDMGCLSSQFDARGVLRLDLLDLARQVGPKGVLAAFNQQERVHYQELTGGRASAR